MRSGDKRKHGQRDGKTPHSGAWDGRAVYAYREGGAVERSGAGLAGSPRSQMDFMSWSDYQPLVSRSAACFSRDAALRSRDAGPEAAFWA